MKKLIWAFVLVVMLGVVEAKVDVIKVSPQAVEPGQTLSVTVKGEEYYSYGDAFDSAGSIGKVPIRCGATTRCSGESSFRFIVPATAKLGRARIELTDYKAAKGFEKFNVNFDIIAKAKTFECYSQFNTKAHSGKCDPKNCGEASMVKCTNLWVVNFETCSRTYTTECSKTPSCKAGYSVKSAKDCSLQTCSDSDNGKDYFTKGKASGKKLGADYVETYEDVCLTDDEAGRDLKEGYCSDNQATFEFTKCPNGCKDGACIKQVECVDSDSGKNYESKGKITSSNSQGEDKCANANTLNEMFCSGNLGAMEIHKCENGCKDGACVKDNITKCTDSDGGKNYNVIGLTNKAKLSASSEAVIWKDICLKDFDKYQKGEYLPQQGVTKPNGLLEGSCGINSNEQGTISAYECPNGCKDGACVKENASKCTDSDGGKNIFEAGKTKRRDGNFWTDTCVNPSQVQEGYCDDRSTTHVSTYVASCANGCKDGACVKGNPNNCTDTDGVEIYTKGILSWTTVEGRRQTMTDQCSGYNNESVVDYVCGKTAGSYYETVETKCPNGCKDGGCLQKNESPCTDSDGGKNYYTAGKTTSDWTNLGVGSKQTKADSCSSNGQLTEYSCSTTPPYVGSISATTITCPNGCKDGSCINSSCGNGIIDKEEQCDSGSLNGKDFCSDKCVFLGKRELAVVCQLMTGVIQTDRSCSVSFGALTGSCILKKGQNQCITHLLLPANANELNYKSHLKGSIEGGSMKNNAYNGVNYFVNFDLNETPCVDTEGGKDYYNKGETTGYTQGVNQVYTSKDMCLMDGQNNADLQETWCENNKVHVERYNCQNGCKDGSCIKESTKICTDSDGGINYNTAGTVTGIERRADGSLVVFPDGSFDYGDFKDQCYQDALVEFYCKEDGGVSAEQYQCLNDCKEGACIQGGARLVILQDFGTIKTSNEFESGPNADMVDYLAKIFSGFKDGESTRYKLEQTQYNPDIGVAVAEFEKEISFVDFDRDFVKKLKASNTNLMLDYDSANVEGSLPEAQILFYSDNNRDQGVIWLSKNIVVFAYVGDIKSIGQKPQGEDWIDFLTAYVKRFPSTLVPCEGDNCEANLVCKDSDGGNLYEKGYSSLAENHEDTCRGNSVIEDFCSDSNIIDKNDYFYLAGAGKDVLLRYKGSDRCDKGVAWLFGGAAKFDVIDTGKRITFPLQKEGYFTLNYNGIKTKMKLTDCMEDSSIDTLGTPLLREKRVECSNGCSDGACKEDNRQVTYEGVLQMLNKCQAFEMGSAEPKKHFGKDYASGNDMCNWRANQDGTDLTCITAGRIYSIDSRQTGYGTWSCERDVVGPSHNGWALCCKVPGPISPPAPSIPEPVAE